MVLEIYNAKLSKRLERRKFVFDRGFLEYKKVRDIAKVPLATGATSGQLESNVFANP